MDRYSNGVLVPKHQTDKFTGFSSDGASEITVTLTYVPRSMNDIIMQLGWNGTFTPLYITVASLSGRNLKIRVRRARYDKATHTQNATSGRSGADPHYHNMYYEQIDMHFSHYANQAMPPIAVIYPL